MTASESRTRLKSALRRTIRGDRPASVRGHPAGAPVRLCCEIEGQPRRPGRRRGRCTEVAILALALAVPILNACSHTAARTLDRPYWRSNDEAERLRAELERAETALRSSSQADAVSALASGRVQVERAALEAPWRKAEIAEARSKLAEGNRQLKAGQFGPAIFFVQRAESIAGNLLEKARTLHRSPATHFVRSARVNVRAEPSARARILAVLPSGTPISPRKRKGAWVKIRLSDGITVLVRIR